MLTEKNTKAELLAELRRLQDTGASVEGVDLPPKALASIASQLLKQSGVTLKDPAGRIASHQGTVYVCDFDEEPGVVVLKTEHDQGAFRLAMERMDAAEEKHANVLRDKEMAEKAVENAKRAGNQPEVEKHEARVAAFEEELETLAAKVVETAKECPQAWVERLRTRAERWRTEADHLQRKADDKTQQALDLEKRGKPSDDPETWDDQMVAQANGCLEMASELTGQADKARAKAQGFIDAMPDCGGAESLVTVQRVRLLAVPA